MPELGGVLAEIVARKRIDVAARLGGGAYEAMRARATPTRRSLKRALAQPRARFIMEIKRASPSSGVLRASADPINLARAFTGAADAISVLTDSPFFGGSLEDLATVRTAFPGPILAKDFVIDERQVAEARAHGADAILVMLSVLDDAEARSVMEEARRLNMDALVEVHDEAEMRRARDLGARLIGINNRDLRSLTVDIATTERLAPLAPANCVLVAESGIRDRRDVERLSSHVDAFLVGSSLMSAAAPAQAARALAFGVVKVCGLTNGDDAQSALAAGASYAGVVFAPGTPRAVTCAQAAPVIGAAREAGLASVGVFRNQGAAHVAESARAAGLDVVQLHGDEDDAYIADLRRSLKYTETWAVCPVGEALRQARADADRTVFDTQTPGGCGGTGVVFDWSRIAKREDLKSGILAGGLTPGNARTASRLGAYALDVGSGVEAAPGRKDVTKLRAFFDALRLDARGDATPC